MGQLFIGVGSTSMCFLILEKKKYIDLSKLYDFADYLKMKRAKELLNDFTNVLVDLNESAVRRMVVYNKSMELGNNDRLYFVGKEEELERAKEELKDKKVFSLVDEYLKQVI